MSGPRSKNPKKRVIVVGAGMAGLTAAAYLLRAGHDVQIIEKCPQCGGLVNSFAKAGFVFDAGPRALLNAGILRPMLKDLGLELAMVKGQVSTGIQGHMVHYTTRAGVLDFCHSLKALFPEAGPAIRSICKQIDRYGRMARLLNAMPNPFFMHFWRDLGLLFTQFIPRLPGFLWVLLNMLLKQPSIEQALARICRDPALSDMLSQHFFKGTPANFAFGYFENYQDYLYPLGGTGRLPAVLVEYIKDHGGQIRTHSEVQSIDPARKVLKNQQGETLTYDCLLWAADLKSLYQCLDSQGLSQALQAQITRHQAQLLPLKSAESVFSLFVAVDLPAAYFAKISHGHFIYTPHAKGLGDAHRASLERLKASFTQLSRQEILAWLRDFCTYNSYEISIPVLKDPSLAPSNQTGLIISLLCDGELFELVDQAGWYAEFKTACAEYMLDSLSIYPDLRHKLLFMESASPLTLAKRFNTSHGAIVGWSMETAVPVPHRLTSIGRSVISGIPAIFRAGQWSYSPAGVPIAILTGRVAAMAMDKVRLKPNPKQKNKR